ncbi:MAG: AmmeMemoRadiSam system radical SAM enzyme [Coriobacteriia bacterium]|nr:AmmeMemoRadiSam system radical SAM enzyme [Coriobacteriia bacterium]
MHPAVLWELHGDRVSCRLCPNLCSIFEGHTGICGVRQVVDGRLVALTYGRISSIAADPIEKKPVFHYHPGSLVLSIGSVGCSMRCGHCQNWEISRGDPNSAEGLHTVLPSTIADMAGKYRCPGVAFTYNEPIIWAEYVADVARACRQAGLFTVMVTNGYVTTEGLDFFGELIDVWRVDLKGATDETYKRLCHVSSAEPVKAAAERAKHHWGMHVEVVTNVVPSVNDSAEELTAMASWIVEKLGPETPWHVTRFFPYLEFAHLPPTPIETLHLARKIAREAGLHFVYLGNIDENDAEDTHCPQCGAVAMSRTGYTILARHTHDGACSRCGEALGIIE